jgi:tripartite-type tricarboxylate transporter receptor subunit TctC
MLSALALFAVLTSACGQRSVPTGAAPSGSAPGGASASPVATFDEQVVANFYRGKTVRILVGFAPGGTFDLYARMVAKVLPKHIPGSPNVVVENKPGAGSMLAANLLYNTEPKDGTAIATFNESLLLQQLIGAQGIEFDLSKFHYLGSAVNQPPGCTIRADLGVTRLEDLRGREIAMGAPAPGTPSYDLPVALNAALGTRFRMVTGYEGIAPVFLAFDSREVDGYCATFDTLSTVARRHVEGDNPAGKVIVIGAAELPNHPAARGAIATEAVAPNDQAKALIRAIAGPARVGKPLAFASEVPADRVAAMRKAVAAAFADPELVADAQNQNLDLSPTDGARVNEIVREVMAAPPEVVGRIKEIMPQQ